MLNNVSFSYDTPVFENISIPQHKGIIAIAGKSGCGKTTLLKTLAGLHPPTGGTITPFDRIGMVFQEPRLFPWFTVEKNLKSILKSFPLTTAEKTARINQALSTVGLSDYKDFYPKALSGGMQMRGSIARALVTDSELLLLDEPLNGLDIANKDIIIRLLRQLSETDLNILFVSHIPEDIIDIADHIYILSPRPATIIDHFDNPLPCSTPYNRNLRNKLIHRIRSGVSGNPA